MSYCSTCGEAIELSDRFCSNCGSPIKIDTKNSKRIESFSYEFSSNIILGGDILNPDRLIIDQTGVSLIKRNKYWIGKDRRHFTYRNISSVFIDRKLIDADIIIASHSGEKIIAQDFSINDAKRIEGLITSQIN